MKGSVTIILSWQKPFITSCGATSLTVHFIYGWDRPVTAISLFFFWWFSNLGFKVVMIMNWVSLLDITFLIVSSWLHPSKEEKGLVNFGQCFLGFIGRAIVTNLQPNWSIPPHGRFKLTLHLTAKLQWAHFMAALLTPYIIVKQMYLNVQSWRRASLEWYICKKEFVLAFRIANIPWSSVLILNTAHHLVMECTLLWSSSISRQYLPKHSMMLP